MPATIKRGDNEKAHGHAIVSNKVKNYENDHYFIKKAEKAKETLERVGLPGQKKN